MIIDRIENMYRYDAISPYLKKIRSWMAEHDISTIETGLYEIEGKNLKVKIQHYNTVPKEERALELHHKYIDVQCVISGQELFGYCPKDDLVERGKYLEEREVEFPQGPCHYLELKTGTFFLAFPFEAHQTKCIDQHVCTVDKAIFKILVNP